MTTKIDNILTKLKTIKLSNDEKIKILNKIIDDLFKIANDDKTRIEEYDKINKLISKAKYQLYDL